MGISDWGITSWPLPLEAQTILQEDNPCPFTAANLEDRLTANTKLEHPRSLLVGLFSYYYDSTINSLAANISAPYPKTNLARYTWAEDYHLIVPKYLNQVALHIKNKLAPLVDENLPNNETFTYEIHCDTSPLADRYIAYLAGLGFYGENHCLIHPQLGSYVVIGSLLTNLDLPADTPLQQTCLGCKKCIKACPGQALGDTHFKFNQCKSYLTQKKDELSEIEKNIIAKTPLIFGCDVCQEVCPHNQGIPNTTIQEFQKITPFLDTSALTELTNKEFKATYGTRAFSWRGKKILLRNDEIIKKDFL